jgi:hypothetical protein
LAIDEPSLDLGGPHGTVPDTVWRNTDGRPRQHILGLPAPGSGDMSAQRGGGWDHGNVSEVVWHCPVCGFPWEEPAWTEPAYSEESLAMFEICPRRGMQFGYHDARGIGWPGELRREHRRLRDKWAASGMPWSSSARHVPEGWDPVIQLESAGLEVSSELGDPS